MKIGLDFDETITLDPRFFAMVIADAKLCGHEVCIVTYRSPGMNNMDIEAYAMENNINVICTSGRQKSAFYDAKVWMDDSPVSIPSHDELKQMLKGCEVNNEY